MQFIFYLKPNFLVSSHLLCLYNQVRVGPGPKLRRPVFLRRGSYQNKLFPGLLYHKISTITKLLTIFQKSISCLIWYGDNIPWFSKGTERSGALYDPSKNWVGARYPSRNIQHRSLCNMPMQYEPRCEKTGLRDFRPGPTKTGLCSHKRWLEA